MSPNFRAIVGACAPNLGGSFPRLFAFLSLGWAAACSAATADQVTAPVAVGMTSSTQPYYSDGNLTLYEVQIPVALPVRRPTSAERQALGGPPKGTPYAHAPFLLASNEVVEVHFVISNIDTAEHDAWLLLDPWNEFVRYRPGVTVVDADVTVPNQSFEPGGPGFVLPPQSRVEGTITADDMHELAIKLAATETYLASVQAAATAAAKAGAMPVDNSLNATALANHIFDPQNRSNTQDPLYDPWIPPIIAGLTGFDLGLRTQEKANIAVEITVDVQDVDGHHFVSQDTTAKQLGTPPAVLSPPGARF
jgi:hypothetical protein